MIPRGAPYIRWSDVVAAASYCLRPGDGEDAQQRVEERWAANTLACLSVRSGFDALLHELAFRAGSEIIVSAVTIPHILDIMAHHRLVAVPVDVDVSTLSVSARAVEDAVTEKTKAVLIAHLFGNRMPVEDIAAVAHAHALLFIEDCAQANDGTDYRGSAESDVVMFSFGSIKRQTAMGGGLLRFRDAALLDAVRRHQAAYPRQSRSSYLNRVLKLAMVKLVGTRMLFPVFVRICSWLGLDHDRTLGTALRGFAHGDLFSRLRQQPSVPLLRTLHRRLSRPDFAEIEKRVAIVQTVAETFPSLHRPGRHGAHHTHWLFPILSERPQPLMHKLWAAGYDATSGASNLVCVPAPDGRTRPQGAEQMMQDILYLPLFPSMSREEMLGLARTLEALDCGEPQSSPS